MKERQPAFRTPEQVAAEGFIRAARWTTACEDCGRRKCDNLHTPEVEWWPRDGRARRLARMARRGAAVEALSQEMQQCRVLCWTCRRKRQYG